MQVPNRLQRNSILTAGLVLLAGASGLFGQTTAAPVLVVPTTNIFFSHQTGGAAPSGQSIRLYSGPASVNYTATATTDSGGGWLFLSCASCATPVSGVTQFNGNTGTGGQDITITVAPSGLLPGVNQYTGTITVVSGATTLPIKVFLSVASTPQLTINPASIPVQVVEAGRTATIPISVNSTGAQQVFTTSVDNPTPNTSWLSVFPNGGFTGTQVQLNINAANIPAGTNLAVGAIRFTIQGTTQSVTLPISVQITPAAQVQVSPATVTFLYQPGFTVPGGKPVNVTSSTSSQLTYTATVNSTPNYFTLSQNNAPSNVTTLSGLSTPGSFYVQPNVSALGANPAPGNYDTTIAVTSTTGSTTNVTARIQVTNQNVLTSSADFVNFAYTLGGTDLSPTAITIGSTSAPLSFSATTAFDAGMPTFFTVSAPSPFTPNSVTVSPDMSVVRNLTAGTYTGKVRLTASGATSPSLEIPVTLTVSGSAQLTVDTFQPAPFEGAIGASQTARTLIVRSTDPNVAQNFTVGIDYGTGPANWLVVTPLSGVTGQQSAVLTYNVNPNAITTAGNYSATLIITPTGVTNPVPIRVTIRYNVSGSTAITVTPARLDLTQVGSTPPGIQSIQLSSAVSNITYLPTVNQVGSDPVFVRIVPQTTYAIPGTLQITLDSATLTPRAEPYVNNITLIPNQAGLSTVTIPVRLTVTSPSNLQVNPASLSFAFTTGGAVPATQTINLTSTGAAIPFTAAVATQQGSWLSVSPTSGTTNASGGAATPLTVSVNPAGLTAGTYSGTVTLTPGSGGGQAVTVNVSLTVTTPNPPNSVQVSNNASGISRGVSPGQFITLKGRNMAPGAPISFQLVNGAVPTTLGEVRVLFDNVPAPVIYVGPSGDRTSDQINAIVPYGISGRASTNLVVEYRGVQSAAISLQVRETEPGIYTANSSGSGAAAMLNQDSSFNTQQNPAAVGSVIQIFGTGEGLILPSPGDGRVVPATPPFPQLLNSNVAVRINGRTARVVYAGPAPGLLAGVFQINAEVPADLAVTGTAQATLEVQIGSTNSQPGVTLFVRGQ